MKPQIAKAAVEKSTAKNAHDIDLKVASAVENIQEAIFNLQDALGLIRNGESLAHSMSPEFENLLGMLKVAKGSTALAGRSFHGYATARAQKQAKFPKDALE